MPTAQERRQPDKLQWIITTLLGIVIALLTLGANSVNSDLSYLSKTVAAIGSDVSAVKQSQADDKDWKREVNSRLAALEASAQFKRK